MHGSLKCLSSRCTTGETMWSFQLFDIYVLNIFCYTPKTIWRYITMLFLFSKVKWEWHRCHLSNSPMQNLLNNSHWQLNVFLFRTCYWFTLLKRGGCVWRRSFCMSRVNLYNGKLNLMATAYNVMNLDCFRWLLSVKYGHCIISGATEFCIRYFKLHNVKIRPVE